MKYIESCQNSEKVSWNKIIPYLLMFMILPPIIGIPLVIYQIWQKENASKTDYYKFFCCIAMYFACINATKYPGGDQINYAWAYYNVPQLGFWGSMANIYGYSIAMGLKNASTEISGEFMNGVYNYIGYYLTWGYYYLFEALITFIDYILVFIGLYKFTRTLNKPHIPMVCGVLILAFFYLYFQFLLHIQKQFLAQSIMMYVLGEYSLTMKMNRKLWGFVAISCFTHASMFLFVPFLCIKVLRGAMNKKILMIMGVLMIITITMGPRFFSSFMEGGNGALTYGMQRFANSEVNNDTDQGLDDRRLLVIALPMCLILYKKLWTERMTLNRNAFILNIIFLLMLAMIGMYNQPTAKYRYFMMLYAFMPFIYPFAFTNLKNRNDFLILLSIIMIGWFYFQFDKIIWHYAAESKIIMYPPALLVVFEHYIGVSPV